MTQSIWQRIVVRAGQALWHVKGTLLIGAIVLGAAATYAFVYVPTQSRAGTSGASLLSSGGSHDCADTVMSALAGSNETQQEAAYQCMDTTFQQRVTPQQFVSQLDRSTTNRGPITKVARVGTYDSPAGATLVYYAVDTNNEQSLGFIVYLGPNGKVLTIE